MQFYLMYWLLGDINYILTDLNLSKYAKLLNKADELFKSLVNGFAVRFVL